MRSRKYFLGMIFLAGALFFSVEPAQAAGCCVLDKNATPSSNNCKNNSNSGSCIGSSSLFFEGDPDCRGAIVTTYCGTVDDSNQLGCCIVNITDPSKAGPDNCVGNKKKSECSGQFDIIDPSCATYLNSSGFCKKKPDSQTQTASAAGTTITTTFVNPIRFSSVSEVVGALLNNLKGIIATVAILFIVIGGVMYILSGGNEKMITTAKNTITSAIIGLAIALAAPTFLKEIKNILGGGAGANPDEMISQALTLNEIVMRILNLLLSLVGILAIIGLIIGGAFYLTAYGDDKRIESGKKIITSSIIGIVIVMAALVIVRQVASLLGTS